MTRYCAALWLMGTAVSALMAPAQAQTSSAKQDESASTDEVVIIVTAQRRSQTLFEVPQSISVLSSDLLERQQATDLASFAGNVPGLSFQQYNPGQNRVVLRGINSGGASPTVSIYVDETPFGSSTGASNGAVLAGDFDTFDVERIEVLRGPQGTLYGANTMGGLIKYITTPPAIGKFQAKGQAGIENVSGGGGLGWSGNGVVNVPLGDTLAVRASGFYRKGAGYLDSIGLDKRNVNDSKSYGGRASLLFEPTDKLSIRLMAVLQNIRGHSNNYDADADTLQPISADPVTGDPVDSLGRYYGVLDSVGIDYRLYTGTLNWDFDFATLTSVTSYSKLTQSQVVDATPGIGFVDPFYGASEPYGIVQNKGVTQKKFTQEVRLASPDSDSVEWLIGGYYTREPGQLFQPFTPFVASTGAFVPPALTVGAPFFPTDTSFSQFLVATLDSLYREYAGFGSVTWHITPSFEVTGGVRYSHNKQSTTQNLDGFLAVVGGGDGSLSGSSSENVLTWSVSPRFELNDRVSIYARVAKGYRPGGPNVVPPGAPADYPASFDADTLISYEAGIRAETADRTFAIDGSVYYLDWKKIQLLTAYETSIGRVTADGNGGGARSYGAEITATLRPTRGFTVVGTAAYNNAKLTSDTIIGGLDGDTLPYAPKWNLGFSADYEWALSDTSTAFVGGDVRVVSDRYADFDLNYQTVFGRRLSLDGYATVDLRAGLTLDRYSVSVFAKNVTNSGGLLNAGVFGLRYGNTIEVAPIRPRTIGATVGFAL